jgi:carboxyl-terminal processing protease
VPTAISRCLRHWALCLPIALAACGGGGGGGDGGPPALSCAVPDRQAWLADYFNDNYLWYQLSPTPSPNGFSTVESYFDALLYAGGHPIPGGGGALWPADTYSGLQSTESFNRFFGDGQTLGYGLAVAGLEVIGQPTAPLYVRYIEPDSPAAAAGIVRGDRVLSLNGREAADIIAADDFSVLTPAERGERLTVVLRNASGQDRSVQLTATVHDLTPVRSGQVLFSPNGRRLGYVFVKDMIGQAASPLSSVMADFRNQGIQELVLDLRYNGGGLVSMGATVASHAAGDRAAGQVYARLLYNDKQSDNNETFRFSNPGDWAGLAKVYVLMGERTCSASEQVINGLRGVGIEVVAVGDVTCGKPVGFLPSDDGCGTTYSIVNFEGVNALNQGRYFDGLAPTCAVAEDFTRPIGGNTDPLLVAAAHHIDNGSCPVALTREGPQSRAGMPRRGNTGADGGERSGMSGR